MNDTSQRQRIRFVGEGQSDHKAALSEAVRRGLTAERKSLPCSLLYDSLGARLFQAICELPEYYLTRAERQILTSHAADIAASIPAIETFVELGSGISDKSQLVIEALLKRSGRLRFVPIDVSRATLEESARQLTARFGGLDVVAICADYEAAFSELERVADGPTLVGWLGSSIGNLHRADAAVFLRRLADSISEGDRLLIGIDLHKDKAVLDAAYDDSLGVTAAFNLNMLVRINRELGADFDVRRFKHSAGYNEAEGRIEMHLVSTSDQTVSIPSLSIEVRFRQDEAIHTENSYKYTLPQIDELAKGAGCLIEQQWFDDQRRFVLNLLKPSNA